MWPTNIKRTDEQTFTSFLFHTDVTGHTDKFVFTVYLTN